MTQTIGEWIHTYPDLLLGLALIGLAFAIALAARVTEISHEIDTITRHEPDEPPVDEWATELEEHG